MMLSTPLGTSEMMPFVMAPTTPAAKLTWAEMCNSRRYRIYAVPSRLLCGLRRGAYRITNVKLPSDAQVVDTDQDYWTRTQLLTVYSAAFSLVPDGGLVSNFGLVGIEAIPGRESESFHIEV